MTDWLPGDWSRQDCQPEGGNKGISKGAQQSGPRLGQTQLHHTKELRPGSRSTIRHQGIFQPDQKI